MTYFIIKFRDEDGDWFLQQLGMWTDTASDACQFRVEAEAERWADEAAARLNRRTDEWHPRSRVRVIKMTGQ